VSDLPVLRDYWYPVAYARDVGTEPYPFRIFGEDHVVWRPTERGPALAALDECPHRAGRLSDGWVADGCLTCPYHGWRFDESGACVEIPATDPSIPIPGRARLHSIGVEERYGLVWVCVGQPGDGVGALREADDSGYTVIHELMETWHASAPRIMDNALDVSHVAWVHRNTVGTPAAPRIPNYEVVRDGATLRCSTSHQSRLDERQKRNTGIEADLTTRTAHIEVPAPFVFRGAIEYENGLIHVLFKTATPVDDNTTLFCQFVARNDSPDVAKQAEIIAVDRAVQAEDRAVLERVKADFPLDITAEVHTGADRLTVEYRRLLAGLSNGAVPTVQATASATH
jgi:phenylpropionate dioxygenase-like ring-hydroxylating dioxygenase large terminal subunit